MIDEYWASISGGKDSYYMLEFILNNLDKYRLDGVIHFELEIDYPFVKDIINEIKTKCENMCIKFISIKPRKSWEELYNKYGFPSRTNRWCNSAYKLDAKNQFIKFKKSLGSNIYFYIGYCKDEEKRYINRPLNEIYPLVENNIYENDVLKWARIKKIYKDYYLINNRLGCMYCPITSYLNLAYLKLYFPKNYSYMLNKIKETEISVSQKLGRKYTIRGKKYDWQYIDYIVDKKYINKILEKVNNYDK